MKIGVVIVTHGRIGEEMVRVAQSIVHEQVPMTGVALEHDESVDQMRLKIQSAIETVNQGSGILLLSDMFGGTPSNLCLSFLKEGHIEVITGVNLPMLIKLASLQEGQSLPEIASFIKAYGQKNIALAGEVLKGNAGS
jgi:PTS system mannose-specific IIA component